MYKLYKTIYDVEGVIRQNSDGSTTSFLKNNSNIDYQRFKKEINEDKAELQDADGNTMTAAEAKAFVATLP